MSIDYLLLSVNTTAAAMQGGLEYISWLVSRPLQPNSVVNITYIEKSIMFNP